MISVRPDWMLIDGSSLIFRAFYGVPDTTRAPDGRQINAVRGFLETLTRLVSSRRPVCLAIASDHDWRPQRRVDLIPSYKAHRVAEPIPPALIPQVPIIEDLLSAIGIEYVGGSGLEAEDVIASWVEQLAGRIQIVSGDRDLFALIRDPDLIVLYPEKGGLSEIDEAEVSRRYGIPGGSTPILRCCEATRQTGCRDSPASVPRPRPQWSRSTEASMASWQPVYLARRRESTSCVPARL